MRPFKPTLLLLSTVFEICVLSLHLIFHYSLTVSVCYATEQFTFGFESCFGKSGENDAMTIVTVNQNNKVRRQKSSSFI